MGILRADRITGLGGANAIKGSTKFSEGRLLEVHATGSNADFRLRNESFTIEFWAYVNDTSNSTFVSLFENSPARRSYQFEIRSSQALRFEWWTDGSSGSALTSSTGVFSLSKWHHFAVVRNGTALNIYVDGTSVANTTTSDSFYENTIEPLAIGGIFQGGALTQDITGFISNLRIIRGEAFYTANFTPPTHELTTTSNTVLLTCQSSGNVLQEATGKTIVARTSAANSVSDSTNAPPEASHFTPNSPVGFSTTSDVGSQYGSTFDGFGNFATSTYMVPPGGNTRERNRGRGLFAVAGPTLSKEINYIQIQSLGNSIRFGDLSNQRADVQGGASSTRALFGAGQESGSPGFVNTIEFVTIANTANVTDFGDLNETTFQGAVTGNETRYVYGGGTTPTVQNVIDFVTIATTGDATNFGDLTEGRFALTAFGSPTRGIYAGGATPTIVNTIDYITIASAGDATDFGDVTSDDTRNPMAVSSATRGVIAGGQTPAPSTGTNAIDLLTIATTGNTTDFGDLTDGRRRGTGLSNSIRGVFAGGYDPSAKNVMDYITIATTGNAQDFGDTEATVHRLGTSASDSHGGLS